MAQELVSPPLYFSCKGLIVFLSHQVVDSFWADQLSEISELFFWRESAGEAMRLIIPVVERHFETGERSCSDTPSITDRFGTSAVAIKPRVDILDWSGSIIRPIKRSVPVAGEGG